MDNLREMLATMSPEEFRAAARERELEEWRSINRFCGKCGSSMQPHANAAERALVCSKCGYTAYPKLSPAVIVLVTKGDKTGFCVFCLPCHKEIDFKAAARLSGK